MRRRLVALALLLCCLVLAGSALAVSPGLARTPRDTPACPPYTSTVAPFACQAVDATAVAAAATPCPTGRSVLYGAVQNVSFSCGVTWTASRAQNPSPIPPPWIVETDYPGLSGGVVWNGKVGVGQYPVPRWTGQTFSQAGMADPGPICASDAYDSGTGQYFVAPGTAGVTYTSVITFGLNSNVGAPCTTANNLVVADWTPPAYAGNVYVKNCYSSDATCSAPHTLTATIPMTGGDLYRITFETEMAYGMFYIDGWTYQGGDPDIAAPSATPTSGATPTSVPIQPATSTAAPTATGTPLPLCRPLPPTADPAS